MVAYERHRMRGEPLGGGADIAGRALEVDALYYESQRAGS